MTDNQEWTWPRYRDAAIEAEEKNQWKRAIDLWQAALIRCPRPLDELGRREREEMQRRQGVCFGKEFWADRTRRRATRRTVLTQL